MSNTLTCSTRTEQPRSYDLQVITLNRQTLKIRDFKDSKDILLLHDRLVGISKMLGVKTAPDDDTINGIISLIVNGFGDFSIEEISNAFVLALSGKLDIDPETYQNFSITYISKVLIACRKYITSQKDIFKNHQANIERDQLHERTQKDFDHYSDEAMYLCVKKWYAENNELPLIAPWDAIIRYLKKFGLLEITDQEFRTMVNEARVEHGSGGKTLRQMLDMDRERSAKRELIRQCFIEL